jgi:hypothetical protein
LSHGETINLKPGEEGIKVTKENLEEYIELVLKSRFEEAKVQLGALREGIKLIFGDLSVIQLMDWEQVEARACGQKTVDIDKLKSITNYYNANEKTPIVKRFWRTLQSFDNEQR